MPKILIGIQARLGSSRLPRKSALPFFQDKTLIENIYNKWKDYNNQYTVAILAPQGESEDPFWISASQNCKIVYGSDDNLLSRYMTAADHLDADIIIRATGDNPFVHYQLVDKSIKHFLDNQFDYLSSKSDDGCNVPQGLGIEIFTTQALRTVYKTADRIAQEHVSEAFLNNSNIRCGFLLDPFNAKEIDLKITSLTLDYLCQYEMLKGLQ